MTSSMISTVNDNERMDPTHPRADGPRRRRAFTAADKLAHLDAYEQACGHGTVTLVGVGDLGESV